MKKNWPIFVLLFSLVLIAFGNSLNNVFLSDDLAEIVNNPNIGNLSHAISTHPFGFIHPVLYWLSFHIGGLNPIFFRLINIFLHTGSVFLVYLIFKRYSRQLGLIVATIFAIHPAISEPVVWISGGGYPQYSFFFLLSFFLYIAPLKTKFLSMALSAIFFLFSFMSHPQMPLSLFVIFPLWELCFGDLRRNWKKSIPYLIVTLIYSLVVYAGLSERENTLQSVHYLQAGIDNPFVLIPTAVTSYFELIFMPITLTLYHSELNFGPINLIIRGFITLLFLIGIGISFKKNKFIFFWLSFFLITLAPTLTPFRLNWMVAERYIYLPIIGILAVFGVGFIHLAQKLRLKGAIYGILLLIIILLTARTIMRNIDWKNEDNLWIATGKTSPSSPNTHNNLGDVYGKQGDKQKALQEFQIAIAIKPNYADAYHNLANTYREIGDNEKALENYQNALKYNPNLWQSYQNIAAIYYLATQYDKALENIQNAVKVNPGNINLRLNLGVIYLQTGQKDQAKEVFNLILRADPQNALAQQGIIEANK